MQEYEEQIAVAGVFTKRAGCLLVPFLPVRAAGAMIVTTKRIIFDPILHYKLLVRKQIIPLDEVSEATASGGNVELNLLDIVSIGKALNIRLKSGRVHHFRSTAAEQLAEAINKVVCRFRG